MYTPQSISPGKPAGASQANIRTATHGRKHRRPPVNGISIDGSAKPTVRNTGNKGFSHVGAMMSSRGR